MNGVYISASGTASFANAEIYVGQLSGLSGVSLSANCVSANNATIHVDAAAAEQEPIDLFSYSSSCSANFSVVVDSTSSECVYTQGNYEEVSDSNGNTVGQVVFSTVTLCSASIRTFAALLLT